MRWLFELLVQIIKNIGEVFPRVEEDGDVFVSYDYVVFWPAIKGKKKLKFMHLDNSDVEKNKDSLSYEARM